MKLSKRTKNILKIASLSALLLLEVYLIYAASASMYTYHQHPRFESADGQVAQSSGYRTQFYLCLAFAVVIPVLAGVLSYFYYFRKPKAAGEVLQAGEAVPEAAAVADDDSALCKEKHVGETDGFNEGIGLDSNDVSPRML